MKYSILFLILSTILLAGDETFASSELEGKNILMIIASSNFRDEELSEPKRLFESLGATVKIASSQLTECIGMLGMKVKPDLLLKDVDAKRFDAVIFVGGIGAKEYFDDNLAQSIAKTAFKEGKILGAICLAPAILANAGILQGKKATVYHSEKGRLKEKGAVYTGEDVTVDGNIVTANGPKSAKDFGKEIKKLLSK